MNILKKYIIIYKMFRKLLLILLIIYVNGKYIRKLHDPDTIIYSITGSEGFEEFNEEN